MYVILITNSWGFTETTLSLGFILQTACRIFANIIHTFSLEICVFCLFLRDVSGQKKCILHSAKYGKFEQKKICFSDYVFSSVTGTELLK